MILEQEPGNSFEELIAELVTIILDEDLFYDNINKNTSKLLALSKNKQDVSTFIKLVDNYYNIYDRCINKEKGESELTSEFRHNFISEIEKYLIEFFFEKVKKNIKNRKYQSRAKIFEHINTFKKKLIFQENLESNLNIKKVNVNLDGLEDLKSYFVLETMKIVGIIDSMNTKRDENDMFSRELKKICLFTSKITNIYQILDDSFNIEMKLKNGDKSYLIAEKINNKREFYLVKFNKYGKAEEILYSNKTKMNDLKDSKIMEGIQVVDEVREKERRKFKEKTYSIYRLKDGKFGLGIVLNNDERILRRIKLESVSIPKENFDDSIFDFSYLDEYLIPELSIK